MTTTIPQLVTAIKNDLKKAAKAETYYFAAGVRLKELKSRKPAHTTWADYVKKQFKMSQQRADELIRIADGKITEDQVRAKKAESMRKTRAKTNGSGKKSTPRGVDQEGLRADQFRNRAGVVKTACDYNPEDPDDVYEPGDTPEMTRRQIFINMVNETIRQTEVLEVNFFEEAAPYEATDELAKAAQKASAAWLKVIDRLKKLKSTKQEAQSGYKEGEKEGSLRSAVH